MILIYQDRCVFIVIHFVTIFDRLFVAQGLALYHSLVRTKIDFTLWIICADSECHRILYNLRLANVSLLCLDILENRLLLAVKDKRSAREYFWTLTPWTIQWVFEADRSVGTVTYVDADLYFLRSPQAILDEFIRSDQSVLITQHSFSANYDQTATSGRYCVQFLSVKRFKGENIIHWWRDKCLGWCYERHEDGLFGDQKYLEHFDSVFPGQVYTTGYDMRFQGPWNASTLPYSEAVVFHFHGLRMCKDNIFFLTEYIIPRPTLESVYVPYCRLLNRLLTESSIGNLPQAEYNFSLLHQLVLLRSFVLRRIFGSNQPWRWLKISADGMSFDAW